MDGFFDDGMSRYGYRGLRHLPKLLGNNNFDDTDETNLLPEDTPQPLKISCNICNMPLRLNKEPESSDDYLCPNCRAKVIEERARREKQISKQVSDYVSKELGEPTSDDIESNLNVEMVVRPSPPKLRKGGGEKVYNPFYDQGDFMGDYGPTIVYRETRVIRNIPEGGDDLVMGNTDNFFQTDDSNEPILLPSPEDKPKTPGKQQIAKPIVKKGKMKSRVTPIPLVHSEDCDNPYFFLYSVSKDNTEELHILCSSCRVPVFIIDSSAVKIVDQGDNE